MGCLAVLKKGSVGGCACIYFSNDSEATINLVDGFGQGSR